MSFFSTFSTMKLYKQLQILSIDVALGAAAGAFLVSRVLSIQLPFIIYFSLSMAVWLIYTLDHLLDAAKMQQKAVTPRHVFHQTYFKELLWFWLFLFVVTGFLSLAYLPIQTIKLGMIAAILVVVHLVLVNLLGTKISVLVQKELGVAITYSAGVVVGPLSMMKTIPQYLWWVLAQLFLCAFINLLEFSYYEKEVDKKQGQTSIARSIGKQFLEIIIYCMLAISLSINVYCLINFPSMIGIQIVLLAMYGVLTLVYIKKQFFAANERYRTWGDAVFLFPVILALLS